MLLDWDDPDIDMKKKGKKFIYREVSKKPKPKYYQQDYSSSEDEHGHEDEPTNGTRRKVRVSNFSINYSSGSVDYKERGRIENRKCINEKKRRKEDVLRESKHVLFSTPPQVEEDHDFHEY